jgi:hypothetical protein
LPNPAVRVSEKGTVPFFSADSRKIGTVPDAQPVGETSMVRVPLLRGADNGEHDDGRRGQSHFSSQHRKRSGQTPKRTVLYRFWSVCYILWFRICGEFASKEIVDRIAAEKGSDPFFSLGTEKSGQTPAILRK